MHKICLIILISTLAACNEGVTHTKWSRPIRNTRPEYNRERRQFIYGEWIPLAKPCPTCRPLVDPIDEGQKPEVSGLVPPRPPTVTRQIHGEGNFFGRDESSVLSVPPPPPILSRHPITGSSSSYQSLQFQNLGSFNAPLPIAALPSQQIFSQPHHIQFVQPSFLPNQNLLVNSNEPILPVLSSSQNNVLTSNGQSGQFVRTGKTPNFETDFGSQKYSENVILDQNIRHLGSESGSSSVLSAKPTQQQSVLQQNSPQSFSQMVIQQQPRRQQTVQHQSFNFDDSILTPPPQPINNSTNQNVVLPGLEKEEIQLLYVPVETLRQRGKLQQQQNLRQQEQSESPRTITSELKSESAPVTRSSTTARSTESTPPVTPRTKGSFVTENSIIQEQTLNSVKLSSPNPFSTASTIFFQNLQSQPNLHPFVSATPITSTESSYLTPPAFTPKLVALSPETTLSHLGTVPSTVQYTTPGFRYVTTPKSLLTEDGLNEEIITGKPQFGSFDTQKFPPSFAFQEQFQQQQLSQQFQGSTKKPTASFQYPQAETEKRPAFSNDRETKISANVKSKTTHQTKYNQQSQSPEHEKDYREQYFLQQQQQKDFDLQQRRQNELEEQRIQQQKIQKQQKQRELEEQRREKEIEQQRYLQRQKEIEQERILQQRRQHEFEEQQRLQKLQDAGNARLLQQRQKEEEERQTLLWQKQQQGGHQNNYKQEVQYQIPDKYQKQKDDNWKKQQFYHDRQQQQILHQVHQVQQQQQNHQTQSANKNIFSEADNVNFISQGDKETDNSGPVETDNSHLVPHQPPLSVFFKGLNKGNSHISDVLKELRNSRSITVLDQYFEKMPKVFVGPAGLSAPTGYDKYDLPYLSNIESRLHDNQVNKLPFFVAPLNYAPPTGYSKIPFPSPHIGSVVISSESAPAVTTKPSESDIIITTSEEDIEPESYPLVGPELPGLINGLETERTTLRSTTTSSLPQTTAQLRNRRPNNSLYRPRKPIFRTRSSTTTTSTTTTTIRPEISEQKYGDSDNGFRKPINRFLKRRRQPTKSTTENIVDYQSEKKLSQNRYYSNQNRKLSSDFEPEKPKYENQGVENRDTVIIREDSQKSRPISNFQKYTQNKNSKNRDQKPILEEGDDSFQSEEEGPYPTGSAQSITQQLYRPNNLRSDDEVNRYSEDGTFVKFEPKVDTSTASGNIYEISETTRYSDGLEANPTVGYNQIPEVKTFPTFSEYTTIKEDKSYTPILTSLKYYAPTEYPKTESPLPLASLTPPLQQPFHASTEFSGHDRFIPAYGDNSYSTLSSESIEFDKQYPTKSSKEQSLGALSLELQAPFADPTQQEKVKEQSFVEDKSAEPTESFQYSEEYDTVSSKNFSSIEDTGPTSPMVNNHYTASFEETTPNFVRHSPQAAALTTTEVANFDDFQKISKFGGRNTDNLDYHPTPVDVSTKYNILNERTKSVEKSQEIEDISATALPDFSKEVTVKTVSDKEDDQKQIDVDNSKKIKITNPSIVRVRTRVRGRQRNQNSYSSSYSANATPSRVKSEEEDKNFKNTGEDYNEKLDSDNLYTSRYNFRGSKKTFRSTTEASKEAESDRKYNSPYTVKPHKRLIQQSTVSTKRIRRPTTPVPFEQLYYEGSTHASETNPAPEYSPSGVSNDVSYEHTGSSRPNFRKPDFNSQEQKDDTSEDTYKLTTPIYSYKDGKHFGSQEEDYSKEEETNTKERTSQEVAQSQWALAESNIGLSHLESTTAASNIYEKETESLDVKKRQEAKKAFDPELNKKGGRRRVRVRVNKRPHENFETAESQNLRTVANVLVPPTSTYKPKDESSFELAKNSEANQDHGLKSYSFRSREYFRKRLNMTVPEINASADAFVNGSTTKVHGDNASEVSGGKALRGKFRGYVRKVIKHPKGRYDGERKSERTFQNSDFDEKVQKEESHDRFYQNASNETRRLPLTRQKTFVRYIKKNKIEKQETQPVAEESEDNKTKENQSEFSADISQENQRQKAEEEYEERTVSTPHKETNTEKDTHLENDFTTNHPEIQETQKPETQSYVTETEESPMAVETELPATQFTDFTQQETEPTLVSLQHQTFVTKGTTKLYPVAQESSPSSSPSSFSSFSPSTSFALSSKQSADVHPGSKTETFVGKSNEERVVYKNKFYQTLRPVYQRAPSTGILRLRETSDSSTTEQRDKKLRLNKFKYGKVNLFGSSGSIQSNSEKQETSEQITLPLNQSKTRFSFELKKHTKEEGKTRGEGFGQSGRKGFRTYSKTESKLSGGSEEIDEKFGETTQFKTDFEVTTIPTEVNEESTTEFIKTTPNDSQDDIEDSTEYTTTIRQATADSQETDSHSSSRDEDDYLTTERIETTADEKGDFTVTSQRSFESSDLLTTTTEGFTATDFDSTSEFSTSEKGTSTTSLPNVQPDLYRFAKHSFSFDETEKFTGTKNRAYVRNITADILENTSGFSASGTEEKKEIIVSPATTVINPTETNKTEEPVTGDVAEDDQTTETTTYQAVVNGENVIETGNLVASAVGDLSKSSKLVKTSTTTKISHETEICYRGRCIRTKSENPDEDLKLLVGSALHEKNKIKS